MLKKLISFAAVCCMTVSLIPHAFAQNSPSEDVLRVMPLGDSITDGYPSDGGYRVTLCNLLEQNGLSSKVDFVGPLSKGNCYDPQHAGYIGYTIDDIKDSFMGEKIGIYSFIDELMQENPADVVMLQIGTNDIFSSYQLDTIGDRLELLVDKILGYLPEDGMLFLATIPVVNMSFGFTDYDGAIVDYNNVIRELVKEKQKTESRIRLSEINSVITKDNIGDGVHPSDAGYKLMGEYWYDILSKYISEREENHEVPVIPGDLDGNGIMNAVDASLMKRHLTRGCFSRGSAEIKAAELTGDGNVLAEDGAVMSRLLLNEE